MKCNVIKRDGTVVAFDQYKIINAVTKACKEVEGENGNNYFSIDFLPENVAKSVISYIKENKLDYISVEAIQDLVEQFLLDGPNIEIARAYIRYRYAREMGRSNYQELMDIVAEKLNASNVQNQNANVDEHSFGGRVGEMSSAVSRKYALDYLVSKMAKRNHENNEIYIHDLDAYAVGSHNCLTLPLDKLLAKGFNTRQADIRPANSVGTAFQLVAVLFQLQSLQQFGGVSASHLDWTMVPYVRKSFRKHWNDGIKYIGKWALSPGYNPEEEYVTEDRPLSEYPVAEKCLWNYAMDMTEKELCQAVEAMYHNLNTLQSRSGNQLKRDGWLKRNL